MFGPNEVSLRDIIRSGASEDELVETISMAVNKKKKKHAGKLLCSLVCTWMSDGC